jgi:hypothetical protein
MAHFQKHWSTDLQDEAKECIQKAVCSLSCHFAGSPKTYGNKFEARYHEINQSATSALTKPRKRGKLKTLLQELELSDDEADSDSPGTQSPLDDAEQPWKRDYNAYIDTPHDVPEEMSVVQWWGVCQSRDRCLSF